MPINFSGQFNTQEAGKLLEEGAITTSLKEIKEKTEEKKSSTSSGSDLLSKIIDSKNTSDAGKEILGDLMAKFASASEIMKFSDKAESVKQTKEREEALSKDEVDISSLKGSSTGKVIKQIIGKIFFSGRFSGDAQNQEKASLAEKYSQEYFDFLSKSSYGGKSEKLKQMETKLKENGFSDQQISKLQKELKAAVRADIGVKIKENMLKMDLSETTLEKKINEKSLKTILNGVFYSDELGGWDFGGYNTSLQGTTDKAKVLEADELGSFALDELKNALLDKILSKDRKDKKETDKKINKLIDLCTKAGVDINDWAEEWDIQKIHMGLNLQKIPDEKASIGTSVDTNTSDDQSRKRNPSQTEEIQAVDEKTLLMNRLKGLYLQRIFNGDLKTYFITTFKIMKVKGEMLKLGVVVKDIEAKISVEAETEAKGKVIESLKSCFLERATLFRLDGTSNNLISEKIKALLKLAERLDMKIYESELETMKKNANQEMLAFVEKHKEMLETSYKRMHNPAVEGELKKFNELEKRLFDEINPSRNAEMLEDSRSQIA